MCNKVPTTLIYIFHLIVYQMKERWKQINMAFIKQLNGWNSLP